MSIEKDYRLGDMSIGQTSLKISIKKGKIRSFQIAYLSTKMCLLR